MEFFQELTFTASLAIVLYFLVVLVTFGAYKLSSTSGGSRSGACCSVSEGGVEKVETLSGGVVSVGKAKGKKRVKFVDDDVIKSVDRCEGLQNVGLLDGVESVRAGERAEQEGVSGFGGDELNAGLLGGNCKEDDFDAQGKGSEENEMLSEKKCNSDELYGVCEEKETSGRVSKEESFDVKEVNDIDDQEKESEKNEILVEKNCDSDRKDAVCEVKEKSLVTSELRSVNLEERKNEVVLENEDMMIDQNDGNGFVGFDENETEVRDGSFDDEDDDWEGIERSELEKVFAEAVKFTEYGMKENDQLAKLDSDVQMQLYGLHKIAVEGPCHEPQPMALKMSARAKWHAWHKLGSMSQELAMEQYIRVLSDSIPGWAQVDSANLLQDADYQGSVKLGTTNKVCVPEQERKLELSSAALGDSSSLEKGNPV